MNGTRPQVATDRPKPRILIADDDAQVRAVLRELLGHAYACSEVSSAEAALNLIGAEEFALVLSDITMEGLSGLEMLPRVAEIAPDTLVVMISAEQKIDSAIRAMRTGAFDYITKPFVLEHVEAVVVRALEHQRLRQEKQRHEEYLEQLLRQRTAELDQASYHDQQTGLPNRVLFEDRLAQALTLDSEGGESLAVLLLDLDSFKNINQLLGYQVGDHLLREVGERLCDCVGESVTVARFGGDEFALLFPRVEGARDAIRVAHHLREGLRPSFNVKGHELHVRASIGISLSPGDGRDVETLLRNTGAALRRAREQGGDRSEFYTAGISAEALTRLSLESDLRHGLERGEFLVHYQPQYCLSAVSGPMRISGAEALVRWQHPELGMIPPAEFIPLAEETGLIVPLGEQVLRAACAQNVAWQEAGFSPMRVAVNLSARQFHHQSLSESVLRVLSQVGLDPCWLELELTESSLVIDAGRAVETLSGLRELGVNIAVDDFGTGYSSLSYLIDLPVDTLKIDRSFVLDATTNARRAKLLKGIVTLAHDLRLTVTAEGVETTEQREMLCRLGCDEMQGYLFGHPVPAGEFEAMLRRESTLPERRASLRLKEVEGRGKARPVTAGETAFFGDGGPARLPSIF